MPQSPTALCALLALLFAPAADAATIQALTRVTSDPALIVGPQAAIFEPGEDVRIEITFDENAADMTPERGVGTFRGGQFQITFGGSGFVFGGRGLSIEARNATLATGTDTIEFTGLGFPGTSIGPTSVSFSQRGGADDLVVDDRPTTGPALFTSARFVTSGTLVVLEGGTLTAVPEPKRAALLLAGLASACLIARRRRG